MDLTKLVERLRGRDDAVVLTFEGARVVERRYATLFDDVSRTIAKLAAWGVGRGSRVGIRASNSYAWLVHDLALIELRAVSIAFTDDFSAETPEALGERYRLSLLLLGQGQKSDLPWVASLESENGPVHCIDRGGIEADPNFDSPFLVFSSGSSGGLKGMVQNRRGVEINIDAFAGRIAVSKEDRWLLFLPISNFQQRMAYYLALWHGLDLIITDPIRVFSALQTLRPTIFIAPPTFYEGVETRFRNLPLWKQRLVIAVASLIEWLPRADWKALAARRLFPDASRMLGTTMRIMVTGMAPIKRSTLDLFRRMRFPLFETYGLAECGSIALNSPGANVIGSVGRLLPGIEIKIADDGEIIAQRDHMVVTRYFQCAEGENERTFIGDGRVATGDIGRVDGDGYLHLTGRKKEVIVTAGGEKVHPEALEAEIDACEDVAKSVVFGPAAARFLYAVIVPKDPADDAARRRIELHVAAMGARRRVAPIEKIVFADAPFSRENGLLRPNLKLDRRQIACRFADQMPALELSR